MKSHKAISIMLKKLQRDKDKEFVSLQFLTTRVELLFRLYKTLTLLFPSGIIMSGLVALLSC